MTYERYVLRISNQTKHRKILKSAFDRKFKKNILTVDRIVFHFCLNKKLPATYSLVFVFFTKAPLFLKEFEKKNLDNEK